jgi:tripartite-type tricarboxylate transporter receptor subunit TctC
MPAPGTRHSFAGEPKETGMETPKAADGPARRQLLAGAAALSATGINDAHGEGAYPARAIKIVIPFSAGAVSDICVRILAEHLARRLGQQIVIDNQSGPGGIAAARVALLAPRDGYTLEILANSTAVAVSQFNNLGYDPFADFIPICGISDFGYVLGTKADSSFQDFGQVLAAMRRRPGAVNLGTSAAGTSPYFMAELLKIMAKVDFAIVPYRLTSELTMAMLRGDVDVYIDTFGAFKSSWEGQRARALATTGATRLSLLPEVPTIAEQGVAGFDVTSWNGLFAPANTPAEAIARLTRDVAATLAEPAVVQGFRDAGAAAMPLPPPALAERLRSDTDKWARVIALLNVPKK